MFLAGFTAGALAWAFLAAWFFTWTGKFINQIWWQRINIFIAICFVGFAVSTLFDLLQIYNIDVQNYFVERNLRL